MWEVGILHMSFQPPPAAGHWAWSPRHVPELSSSFRIFSLTRSSHWRRICTASSMGQWSKRILSMASSLSPGSRVPVLHEWGGDGRSLVQMGTAPPPWPHPCLCGTPPVCHAALLDVGDDQGFPSLSAGRCGAGETGCEFNLKGYLLKAGRTLLTPGPITSCLGDSEQISSPLCGSVSLLENGAAPHYGVG